MKKEMLKDMKMPKKDAASEEEDMMFDLEMGADEPAEDMLSESPLMDIPDEELIAEVQRRKLEVPALDVEDDMSEEVDMEEEDDMMDE